MEFIKRILLATLFVWLGVFSNLAKAQPQSDDARVGTVTEPTGDSYKPSSTIGAPLSRVIFYRAAHGYGVGATGIEINGHYHTSLQLGSYAELCMAAPTKALVSARLVHVGDQVKNFRDSTTQLNLRPAQEAYVRVADMGNGRASFQVVEADIAKTELRQTRRQIHAISRVPNAVSCEPTEVKPAAPTSQIEVITLGSDALFAFGKSDVASISADGRVELDKLVKRLQTRYGSFDSKQIQVVGYADPLGSDVANKRLSAARAQTIKSYMIAGGIDANKITSEGRGAASPVVTNCPREATPQSIACNKPNRRVVVGVSVIAR